MVFEPLVIIDLFLEDLGSGASPGESIKIFMAPFLKDPDTGVSVLDYFAFPFDFDSADEITRWGEEVIDQLLSVLTR